MRDILRVDVAQAVDDLLEDLLSEWFLESPSFTHVVQKVTTCAQVHHNYNMLLRLNRLIDLHNMVMAQFQQKVDFFHEFSFLHFVGECLFVE